MRQTEPVEDRIRRLEAWDERQYMLNENYEVYEKQGEPVGAAALHYHNFYEIIYVMEGEFASLAEDKIHPLHRGDFLLLNRNVMHKYQPAEKKQDVSRRIILWVTDGMLERLGEGDTDLSACFHGESARVCHFPVYYEEMLRGFLLKLAMSRGPESEPPGTKAAMDRGYLILFFTYLNMLCRGGEYFSTEELAGNPLVEQVSAYIDGHMEEAISLGQLAEQVHMSKYYFLRKFKEMTGVTVHAFLMDKRLIRACQYLREGRSITQVWQSCGFANYSSFLRNFRAAYGVAPGKYLEFYPEGAAPRPPVAFFRPLW